MASVTFSLPQFCGASYSYPKKAALLFDQIFYYYDGSNPDYEKETRLLFKNGISRFFFRTGPYSPFQEIDLYEDSLFYSLTYNTRVIPIFSNYQMFLNSMEMMKRQPNHPETDLTKFAEMEQSNMYTEAFSFCIEAIPQIDERALSWEQVIEIRKDKTALEQVRRFQRWLITDLIGKSKDEIQAILGSELDAYKYALKKHGILTFTGALTSVITATPTIHEFIESGSLNAAIAIGAGLTTAMISGAVNNYFEYKETKMTPIAYIYDIVNKIKK